MKAYDLLTDHFRLVESQRKALLKLNISRVIDLLYHFPVRYGDTAEIRNIRNLEKGDKVTLFGRLSKLKTSKGFIKKVTMATGVLEDDTGSIKVVWFNQPYLAKMLQDGMLVKADGVVSQRKEELYLNNPKVEPVSKVPIGVGESLFGDQGESYTLYPVYPESKGITSNWIYHAIQKIFKSGILETLADDIPEEIYKKYNLPSLATALVWIHAPKKQADATSAQKRFAFEEVFFIQLKKQSIRNALAHEKAYTIAADEAHMEKFVSRFPFEATAGQKSAIDQILKDMHSGHPMSRLLEGDVGSGKTAVAAATVYAVCTSRPNGQNFGNLQVAYMCPTEILATQHFESFIKYFQHLPIQIGLITGSGCKKFPSKTDPTKATPISRTQLLKWVGNGEIPVVIGTHALIQKAVKFKHLAYVVIDEQHRFGVVQRQKLTKKDEKAPHLLSMTATPIPRTLALTIYGDLDISVLDQMPLGRKPVITEVVLPTERNKTYEAIKKELKTGRQAYVICPRISEPDPDTEVKLNVKSVKEEAIRLKKDVFPEYEIGLMHSKMTPKEKETVMKDFENGEIDILVSTSVVEVGVNVPNATVIIIEGGERFGLAQLHQLRGRVIRGTYQAYCYIFADTKTDKTIDRLKAFKTAKNGFELAEYDLGLRGSGELYAGKQWGLTDLAMDAIKNMKMVEAARAEAFDLLKAYPSLVPFPRIKKRVEEENEIHFE